MSKSTSPGADKAQEAEGKRQRDSQEIKYHISTYISQQDGKNKNTLPLSLSLSAAVCLGSFHYHFPRFSYSYLPYSIFGICICSTTLFLLHALTPFARVGRQLPPQTQTHSSSRPRTQKETLTQSQTERERERFVCKCPLCKSAGTHDRFFSIFPLPLLFIMNY